jgi:hypothetical protein
MFTIRAHLNRKHNIGKGKRKEEKKTTSSSGAYNFM